MNADLIVRARGLRNPGGDPLAATTLAIRGDRIVAMGGDEILREHAAAHTRIEMIDGVILPGLVDIHTHPVWGSIERGTSLDLDRIGTLGELLAATGERIDQLGTRDWITGFNLDVNLFDGQPSGQILGERFPGVKISYMTADAHALVVSPAVIAHLGITGREQFADASRIHTDAQGAPTGYIVELQAMDLVMAHYPDLPIEQAADHVLAELSQMAACGLTGVHALDFAEPSEAVYKYLDDRGLLPLKVRCSPLIPADSGPEAWERAVEQQALGGRRWQVAGVKFMLDGTADNGSAWFAHPDCYGQNTDSLWRNPEAYRRAIAYFSARGIPTATHAIGDAAVAYALDAIEAAGPVAGGAHRIEHLESIGDQLLPRFAQLGVIASVQPVHGIRLTSPDGSDNWSVRLGSERSAHGWRTRDLLRAKAPLALGSDWPIGAADPRIALADAQLRRPVEQPGAMPLHLEQALTAAEAYHAMTSVPALAAGQEGGGILAPGACADLTIFARDPLSLEPRAQAANPVLATIVDGKLEDHRCDAPGNGS
ncbi:amidohydrolase [Glutamicibacter sp. TV12E]|uniref:amidohydrolase n=1 Tax=Glutamicibacter sp. TV12E TaxID=3446362 RepID=UPI0040339755